MRNKKTSVLGNLFGNSKTQKNRNIQNQIEKDFNGIFNYVKGMHGPNLQHVPLTFLSKFCNYICLKLKCVLVLIFAFIS